MPEPFCPLIQFAQRIGGEFDEHWAVSLMRIAHVNPGLLPDDTFCDRKCTKIEWIDLSEYITTVFTISNTHYIDGRPYYLSGHFVCWQSVQSTWVTREGALPLCRSLGLLKQTEPDWAEPLPPMVDFLDLPDEETMQVVLNAFRPLFFRNYGVEMYPPGEPPRRLEPPSWLINEDREIMWEEDSDGGNPQLVVRGYGDDLEEPIGGRHRSPVEFRTYVPNPDQDEESQALADKARVFELEAARKHFEPTSKNEATDARASTNSAAAAPGPDASAPMGWSQERFEKVLRWRERQNVLIADPKNMVTTKKAAAVEIAKMEERPANPNTVHRDISRLERHLRAAPMDPSGDQE